MEKIDLGKGDNLVELAGNLLPVHSKYRAVQVNIFAASQVGMKSSADTEQAPGATIKVGKPSRRPSYARQNPQQCRFARAVATNDPYDLAGIYFKTNAIQRPNNWIDSVAAAHKPGRAFE